MRFFKDFDKKDIEIWNARILDLISGVNYYVYFHYLDGELFYIGKGSKKRCLDMDDRGSSWNRYVGERKDDVVVDIAKTFYLEEQAFEFEKEQILKNSGDKLTNVIFNNKYYESRRISELTEDSLAKLKKDRKVFFNKDFDFNIFKDLSDLEKDLIIFLLSFKGSKVTTSLRQIREYISTPYLQSTRIRYSLSKMKEKGFIEKYCFYDSSNIHVEISAIKENFSSSNKTSFLMLQEFVLLKSHSKSLFFELSKFKEVNELKMEKENVINIFLIPETYNENYFIKRILIPSIREVELFFGGIDFVNYKAGDNFLPDKCVFALGRKMRF